MGFFSKIKEAFSKTTARLKAQYYETEKHDSGMMRMYIPKKTLKALKEKVEE